MDIEKISDALRAAELVLAESWRIECLVFPPHQRDMKDRPDLCAEIKDQFGQPVYPTAGALVKVRAAIQELKCN